MRTIALTSFITILCLALSFTFESQPAMSVSAGAPEAKTGSPSDGATCFSQCHGANPGTPNGSEMMTLTGLPAGGYMPGQTYNLNLALSGGSHDLFGFQISPQDWTGHMQGTWSTGGSNLVQITNTKWLTQTFAGNSGSAGAIDWDFQWEAPGPGTGDVNFYFTSIFADGMNAHLGDVMLQDSVMIAENTNVGIGNLSNDNEVEIKVMENQILIDNPIREKLHVSIFDVGGRAIYTSNFSDQRYNIDLLQVSTEGIHLIVIKGSDFQTAERIIRLK